MQDGERILLSGNEAVALAAIHAGVSLGSGYPGTPSTEILERFAERGGRAQWAPNEKVALEVGVGVSFTGARSLVTMKHVGLNVAADPLFTAAYTGVTGALVIAVADDPGMASSQNEQDSRRYAVAAGLPMFEPSDSQEAHDFFLAAVGVSERWGIPVLLRMSTRVCHSKTVLRLDIDVPPPADPFYKRDIPSRVMVPAYARPAHRRLRNKLNEIQEWNEQAPFHRRYDAEKDEGAVGVIASGISFMYAREAAPDADILKLGMTHPLPIRAITRFANSYKKCVVVEEGDPYLYEALRAAGCEVEGKTEMFRFGELNVARTRRILANDDTPETPPPPGKPPQLCPGCPHRPVFETLRDLNCIVSGDIGCYSLGVLPPFEAMDTLVCMGASISTGLGMRHALPDAEARRVVSVIGDSTFFHSGLTGLAEMAYNPPKTGHIVLILDNETTAMTGLQEHPGTGRSLDHRPAPKLSIEAVSEALGADTVATFDPVKEKDAFKEALESAMQRSELTVLVTRRSCLLASRKIREYERAEEQRCACELEESAV